MFAACGMYGLPSAGAGTPENVERLESEWRKMAGWTLRLAVAWRPGWQRGSLMMWQLLKRCPGIEGMCRCFE